MISILFLCFYSGSSSVESKYYPCFIFKSTESNSIQLFDFVCTLDKFRKFAISGATLRSGNPFVGSQGVRAGSYHHHHKDHNLSCGATAARVLPICIVPQVDTAHCGYISSCLSSGGEKKVEFCEPDLSTLVSKRSGQRCPTRAHLCSAASTRENTLEGPIGPLRVPASPPQSEVRNSPGVLSMIPWTIAPHTRGISPGMFRRVAYRTDRVGPPAPATVMAPNDPGKGCRSQQLK